MSITSTRFAADEIVYFVLLEESGEIKIGTTCQFAVRIEALCRKYGTVVLLGNEAGGLSRERALHERFKVDRINPARELFRASPDLVSYIGGLGAGEHVRFEADSPTGRMTPMYIR